MFSRILQQVCLTTTITRRTRLAGAENVHGKLRQLPMPWLLAWQIGARFTFPEQPLRCKSPQRSHNYTGNGDTFNGHFVGGNPALSNSDSLATNQWGINSLL
mgnify:CR=1 FL=1